jgi:hypothetical protein
MKQVIVNEDTFIELEDLYTILLIKTSKEGQIKKQIELFEFYKNLNPRYFEEAIPLKEAIETHYTSNIILGSKFNIFRVY